jgi:tRNA nucleotidyltransferase/poly(A) polymerase
MKISIRKSSISMIGWAMKESARARRVESLKKQGVTRITRWLGKNPFLESFIFCFIDALHRKNSNAELYLVGGSVRDLLEGKRSLIDIDLMVTGLNFDELGSVLAELRDRSDLLIKEITGAGKHFPVYKASVFWSRSQIDIALARREVSTGSGHRDFLISTEGVEAENDSARRDFTINALFFKFPSRRGRDTGSLVDYQGGMESLARKEIKAVGEADERFREDPLRMLRAIRQKNQRKGFTIEKSTWDALKRNMPLLINTLSGERIAQELIRSLKANAISTYGDWKESGALVRIIPELSRLSPEAEEQLLERFRCLPHFGRAAEMTPLLLLSCLLSEPALSESELNLQECCSVRGIIEEGENLAVKSPENIARRMMLPNIREIRDLLNGFIVLVHFDRLAKKLTEVEKILTGTRHARELLILYKANQMALSQDCVDVEAMIEKFAATPRILTGRDLLDEGFAPGPTMGIALESIREKQLEGVIASRDEALALACLICAGKRGGAP